MSQLSRLAYGLGLAVVIVIGLSLVNLAALVAIPVWLVLIVPLGLVRLATRRPIRLTLPYFMAYGAQLVTTALSRTVLRRLHAGNLEEWPWNQPPRRLRDGLI